MVNHYEKSSRPSIAITVSKDFSTGYPNACVGILVIEDAGPSAARESLDEIKSDILSRLRKQFPDQQILKNHPIISAYTAYYKTFKKSYHLLGQLRSVIFDNRPLPSGIPLVDAVVTAELGNMLLTAVHDLKALQAPVEIAIASGTERYTTLGGNDQTLKRGDMFISDQTGILSSIIYGPDQRSHVTPATSSILVAVYAPEGIEKKAVAGHLANIREFIGKIAPYSTAILQDIFPQD